jgi:hypothetical protein
MTDEELGAFLLERARCLAIVRRWGLGAPDRPHCSYADVFLAIEDGTSLAEFERELAARAVKRVKREPQS